MQKLLWFALLVVMATPASAQTVKADANNRLSFVLGPPAPSVEAPVRYVDGLPAVRLDDMQAPVTDPTAIEFAPSPDHDRSFTDLGVTVNVVTSYTMNVYKNGLTTPTAFDLGKPAPVGGKITYVWPASIRNTLGQGSFTAEIVVKGPGGSSAPTSADAPFTQAPKAPPAPGAAGATKVLKQ